MAKRYFPYDNLKGVNGKFKPTGTMGTHFCTVIPHHDGRIEVLDVQGNSKVIINPGDTLGYDCGDVWRIPNPDTVRDPLRRALLQNKISKSRLHWVDDLNVAKLELDELDVFQLPGCVAFYTGEVVYYESSIGFITKKYKFKRPITQLEYLGDIYVLKGTPRYAVAELINRVTGKNLNNV